MKVILVTGGCGFIASNFLLHVVGVYPHIMWINLDKLDYCANVKNVEALTTEANYKFIEGNVANHELLKHVFEEYRVDGVIHFAAQSHVCRSFQTARAFVDDNIVATSMLMEVCSHFCAQLERIIYVSTDEVVGDCNEGFADETAPHNPSNPYSASKACCEIICKSYANAWRIPLIITRGNNVYGPRQYPEKVVPAFIRALQNNGQMQIHGDGSSKRTFMYIADAVQAYVTILFKGLVGETYNIASAETNEKSVLEIAGYIAEHVCGHLDENHIAYVSDRVYNDRRYHIDGRKLQSLGWVEKYDVHRGLVETVNWYKNNPTWWACDE